MNVFQIVNVILGVLFLLGYAYQFFYIFYTFLKKPKKYPVSPQTNRYAVLICARNEEKVIGQLLDSIEGQDYPRDRFEVFVCADNCTDRTAAIARTHGAQVLERHSDTKIGKGYALHDLFNFVFRARGEDAFDGYLIVDADNLLDPRFLTEMDRCFSAGNRIVTSYRNTKNFGANWLASSYALWFYHESRQLNNARTLLGVSGAVAGTGFLVHRDIIKENGGWKHFLLIEDVEFSVDCILKGEKIAYCHDAILYDEQPTDMRQSWNQRLRWSRGYLQVLRHYGKALVKKIFQGSFSAYDMLMNISIAYLLTPLMTAVNLIGIVCCAIFARHLLASTILSFCIVAVGAYLCMLLLSTTAAIQERKRIHGSRGRLLQGIFTFPFFMMTFIPIGVTAMFQKQVTWKPITHENGVTLADIHGEQN